MMRWGRKKPVSNSGLSWFSKLSGSSVLKPAKDKKEDDEVSKNMSVKSSLKAATKLTDMESNEKFEKIMSSVRKKVRGLQRDTGTVIMTPRIQVNRDKQRCERRDQRLLEQKPQRSVQESEVIAKKPARKTGRDDSVTKQVHQWQKLKEIKLREVKLKADQQRKSLYLKREVNTKDNSKVRVFSPRSCRVKAIEEMKKAKLRAKDENFAVVKCSSDPLKDFRDSMMEMIIENGINHPEELKELLVCYLRLNTDEYHDMIIKVFHQVHTDLNL